LHRVRSRLVGLRTGVINQIRGFLIERGITVRQGPRASAKASSARARQYPTSRNCKAVIGSPHPKERPTL
jgi:hypothetical protein